MLLLKIIQDRVDPPFLQIIIYFLLGVSYLSKIPQTSFFDQSF